MDAPASRHCSRGSTSSTSARARRLAQRSPVTFVLFDLLYLDGVSTVGLSYLERRRLLESLGLEGERWNVPATHPGPGADLLAAARSVGLEGVVAKRSDSPYRPGQRSGDWVKVKVTHTQEVLVGGWTPGKGERTRRIGALLVGVPGDDGLEYVGKVGTGFTEATLADLQRTPRTAAAAGPALHPPAARRRGRRRHLGGARTGGRGALHRVDPGRATAPGGLAGPAPGQDANGGGP